MEKDFAEKHSRRLEERCDSLKRAAEEAGESLREALDEREALRASNERLKKAVRAVVIASWHSLIVIALQCMQAEEHSQTVQHSRLLESHNQQLQASLFDIAQIVLDDADREGGGDSSSAVAIAVAVEGVGNGSGVVKSNSSPLVRAAR